MAILLNRHDEILNVRKMPNSEIEMLIQKTYKTEKRRNILRDRILNQMTYREIIIKHFPKFLDQSERLILAQRSRIQQMETKFYRVVRKYGKH